jgi:hypothetical protein
MRFVENLSFEDALKTSGKDRKNTLKTSGEDRCLDMSPLTRKVMTTRIGSLHSKRV